MLSNVHVHTLVQEYHWKASALHGTWIRDGCVFLLATRAAGYVDNAVPRVENAISGLGQGEFFCMQPVIRGVIRGAVVATAAAGSLVIAGAGPAAGAWGVTVGRAGAGPSPIVRQFMCPLPIIGTQSVTLSVVRPAVDTATVGVPTPRLPITPTGTLAAAARLAISFLGAEWAEGTGVVTGEVDSPQGPAKESVPFTVPRTDVATGSGPLSVSGSGTLPSMTFSRPGDGEILATGLTVHFSLLTSGGGQTFLNRST